MGRRDGCSRVVRWLYRDHRDPRLFAGPAALVSGLDAVEPDGRFHGRSCSCGALGTALSPQPGFFARGITREQPVFFTLTALNAAGYGYLYAQNSKNNQSLQLLRQSGSIQEA